MSSPSSPSNGPQPTAQVLAWLRGILPQLESLHRAGQHHGALSAQTLGEDAQGQTLLAPAPTVTHDEDLHGARAPGYAALEQYAGGTAGNVGPWTDVYALSAELCRRVTGALPPDAIARVISDTHVPLASRDLPGYPVILLKTIDAGLVLSPENRSPSLAGYTALLAAAGQVGTVPMAPVALGAGAAVAPPAAVAVPVAPVAPPAAPPVMPPPTVAAPPVPALEEEWMPAPTAVATQPDAPPPTPVVAPPVPPLAATPPTAQPAPPPAGHDPEPLAGRTPAAAAAVAAATRPVRQDEGRVPVGMVAAVLGLIIVAGLLFWWQQGDSPEDTTVAGTPPSPSATSAPLHSPQPDSPPAAPPAPPPVAMASTPEAPPASPAPPMDATPAPGSLPGMDAPPASPAPQPTPSPSDSINASPASPSPGSLPGLPGLSPTASAADTAPPQAPPPDTGATSSANPPTPDSGPGASLPTLSSPLPGLSPSSPSDADTGTPADADAPAAPANDDTVEAPAANVAVTVNVQPWGEIVVNGTRRGVSPPLRQIQLAPGTHSVTVRNGNLPPYNTKLTVQAGKPASISHKF